MAEPKFTVAICGAAIGGLSLAAFLSEHSTPEAPVKVDIYESWPDVSMRGAGIGIWQRSWQVLRGLSMDGELDGRGVAHPKDGEARGPVFRKSDQPEDGYEFYSHIMPYGPLSLPRPLLLELIQDKLSDNCTIHTNKRLARYEDPGRSGRPITLFFEDGTTAQADVLVGADGVNSATRATFFEELAKTDPDRAGKYRECIAPKWDGCLVYRTLLSAEKLRAVNPSHISIQGRPQIHALTNPTGGDVLNFIVLQIVAEEGTPFDSDWVLELPKDDVVKVLEGWEPAVQELLQVSDTYNRWAIHIVEPIPQSVQGRVALLGDAAYAMAPHQGVGGGQAMEDAHMLGRLLAHKDTTLANVSHALQVYERLRLRISHQAAEKSSENGLMYAFIHPRFAFDQEKGEPTGEQLEALGQAVGSSFQWLAHGGCQEDWELAEKLLKEGKLS